MMADFSIRLSMANPGLSPSLSGSTPASDCSENRACQDATLSCRRGKERLCEGSIGRGLAESKRTQEIAVWDRSIFRKEGPAAQDQVKSTQGEVPIDKGIRRPLNSELVGVGGEKARVLNKGKVREGS